MKTHHAPHHVNARETHGIYSACKRQCLHMVTGTAQEAQLSQRGRAMFHVTEYFAKSLKVTQGIRK